MFVSTFVGVGTTARLALALALYTGQRRSDLVLFSKQHVQKGWLAFTQQKGKEVTRYTKAASQRVRAEAASAKLGGGQK